MTKCRTKITWSPEPLEGPGMMPRPKGPATQSEKVRYPVSDRDELDREVAESDGVFTTRAQLIRHLIRQHTEARKIYRARKKR